MLHVARRTAQLAQSGDFKKDVLAAIGDLAGVTLLGEAVLIATYIRPERTTGGIIRPTSNVEEDLYQAKVGLVLKVSELADGVCEPGTYIVFRPSDTWDVTICGVACRLIPAERIRMTVTDPDLIF